MSPFFDRPGSIPTPTEAPDLNALKPHVNLDTLSVHGLVTPPPGGEPISPLIQLIMRIPGQFGALSSFCEAFSNFFTSHIAAATAFDPSILAQHAAAGQLSAANHLSSIGEHVAFDPAFLPHNAPIFHGLTELGHHSFSLAQLGGGLRELGLAHTHGLNDSLTLTDSTIGKAHFTPNSDSLNVSRDLDFSNPQVEGTMAADAKPGELLAGPSTGEVGAATHIANNTRLFSDRLSGTNLFSASNATSATQTTQVAQAAGTTLSEHTTTLDSMNVADMHIGSNASTTATAASDWKDALNAHGPSAQNNVSDSFKDAAHSSNDAVQAGYGPSGAPISPSNQNLLAMDKGVETFRPTMGASDASVASKAAISSTPIKALVAKPLSLNSPPSISHTQAQSTPTDRIESYGDGSVVEPLTKAAAKAPSATTKVVEAVKAKAPEHHAKVEPHHVHKEVKAVAKAVKPVAKAETKVEDAKSTSDGSDTSTPSDTSASDSGAADSPVAKAADSAKDSTYTIRAGDCLWNIAKDQLGSGARWSEIYKLNNDVLGTNPDMILPGQSIHIPGAAEIAQAGSDASKYVVHAGDNLWNISKDHLGGGQNWNQIYDANKDIIGNNPDLIRPGQEFSMPGGDAHTASLAQAPGPSGPAAPDPQAPQLAQAQVQVEPAVPVHSQPPVHSSQSQFQAEDMSQMQPQLQSIQSPAPASPEFGSPAAPSVQSAAPVHQVPLMPHTSAAQPHDVIPAASADELRPDIAPTKQAVVSSSMAADLQSFLNRK